MYSIGQKALPKKAGSKSHNRRKTGGDVGVGLSVENVSAASSQRLAQFQVERAVRRRLPGTVHDEEELQDNDNC